MVGRPGGEETSQSHSFLHSLPSGFGAFCAVFRQENSSMSKMLFFFLFPTPYIVSKLDWTGKVAMINWMLLLPHAETWVLSLGSQSHRPTASFFYCGCMRTLHLERRETLLNILNDMLLTILSE